MLVRFFIVIFFVGLSFLLPASTFAANDLSPIKIICHDKGECQQNGKEKPFFSQGNLAPGQQVTRTIVIQNDRKKDSCDLRVTANKSSPQQNNALAQQLTFIGQTNNRQLISVPLSKLFSAKTPAYFDTIGPKTKREYTLSMEFNSNADNRYQAATTTFDLNVIFSCETSSGSVLGTSTEAESTQMADRPLMQRILFLTLFIIISLLFLIILFFLLFGRKKQKKT